MRYELSETSRLWFSEDTTTLLIHNSIKKILLGWFCMVTGILLFIVYHFFEHTLFYVGIGSILFLYGLLSFGYKEFVIIDTKQRMVKRQSKMLDFCFYTKFISWEKKSELKYVIAFNSLERISFISLLIYTEAKDEYTFIMNFPEAKAFYSFKKLFNNKNPECAISETTRSKVEFASAEVHRKQIKSSHDRVRRHKDYLL